VLTREQAEKKTSPVKKKSNWYINKKDPVEYENVDKSDDAEKKPTKKTTTTTKQSSKAPPFVFDNSRPDTAPPFVFENNEVTISHSIDELFDDIPETVFNSADSTYESDGYPYKSDTSYPLNSVETYHDSCTLDSSSFDGYVRYLECK